MAGILDGVQELSIGEGIDLQMTKQVKRNISVNMNLKYICVCAYVNTLSVGLKIHNASLPEE